MISLIYGIQKVKQTSEYTKRKQTPKCGENVVSGHKWGEGREERHDRDRELRGANFPMTVPSTLNHIPSVFFTVTQRLSKLILNQLYRFYRHSRKEKVQ